MASSSAVQLNVNCKLQQKLSDTQPERTETDDQPDDTLFLVAVSLLDGNSRLE